MSVYLDHAASSPMRPEAVEAFVEASAVVGNPASLHRSGQRARSVLEEAREGLAEALGAQPSEVIFTSGGSEADSIAVLGGLAARESEGRHRMLVSAIEHPAVIGAVGHGAELLAVTRDGVVDATAAAVMIDATVAVVSVMAVNNETGVLQPVEEIRRLAARSGAWMHSDAVQALGHVPVDFGASHLDLMSLSAHKIGGPVGIGALLAGRAITPAAIGLGGGQERGVRSGTAAVALAASFACATRLAVQELEAEALRLGELRDRVAAAAVAAGARLNSRVDGAPHIVNATFGGIRADALLFLLDQRGVHASVGSACRAGVHQPSEVLLAMGRTVDEAGQSLRFSLGHTTTDLDITRLESVLPLAVEQARAVR